MSGSAIAAERTRTLYVQMSNSTAAAAIVTVYMVLTAWTFTSRAAIAGWVAVQLASQAVREVLRRRFIARAPAVSEMRRWAHAVTAYMSAAGLIWGATIWLFGHPDQPISIALTLCGLYGIVGGSVPGNAYNPPGLIAFAGLIFASVFVRLLLTGNFSYAVLGAASAGFAAIMIGFCRVQSRTVDEGFRIRFDNMALLDALSREKAESDAARRRAESANLAKSQFLAAASHDLRQPLYALSLFSASLKELDLGAEGRRVVGEIEGSVAALEGLFEGLLDLSRLEAGVVRADRTPVAITALFDQLARYYRPLGAREHGALRFRPLPVAVLGDAALIEQAMSNMLANALRHARGADILVSARRRDGAVILEVWDQGPGIAPADCERIFEEFVQLDNPERDRQRGLGLGLSIAQRAVALMESAMTVRSRVGHGSRFGFALPAVGLPSDVPLVDSGAFGGCVKGRLLVVDDNRDVRRAVSALLTRWGQDHDLARDADEAVALFAGGARYTLILADQRLPGTPGLELLDEIGQRFPDAKRQVALVTADHDPDLLAAASMQGVPVLHKPLKPGQLRALIAKGS